MAPTSEAERTWSAGDFAKLAAGSTLAAELLCESAELRAGQKVLDVATGSGNTALAAARRRTVVTGVDVVPALLDRARLRAEAEGLSVTWTLADALQLPFPDAAFDVVLSTFGVMFAADPSIAVAELLRVVRPSGVLALAAWTPDGYTGRLFAALDRAFPEGRLHAATLAWGTEEAVRRQFVGNAELILSRRQRAIVRGDSLDGYARNFLRLFPPGARALASLDATGQERLTAEVIAIARDVNRSGDATVLLPSEYLEVVLRRA